MSRALALLAALAASAHAETRPRYGGTIEATLLGAPATLDPVAARTHAEVTVVGLVFDTLYRDDGAIVPHVASDAPVIDRAGTSARIAIRRGIKLHDGSELAATDVAASLDRVRAAAPWILPEITSVKADVDAIELHLGEPTTPTVLMRRLGLPQTAITKGGKPPGARVIGSGPFVVEALDRAKRRLVLRAFDDHFTGRPYIDRLAFNWYDKPDAEARAFETDALQVSVRGAAAFAGAQPKFRAEELETSATVLVFVGFGKKHATIVDELAFRRALDLAIARRGLTAVTSGERVVPTREPEPDETGAHPPPPASLDADIVAAKAELAGAAKRVPALNAIPKLEILVEDTRPDDRQIAERVVLALDQLSITATITPLGAPQLRERVDTGACDLWIGQLTEPIEPYGVWWGAAFAAGGDPAGAIAAVMHRGDQAAQFAAKLPILPLMFRAVQLWHRTDLLVRRLDGLTFDVMGRFSFADAFLFGQPVRNRR